MDRAQGVSTSSDLSVYPVLIGEAAAFQAAAGVLEAAERVLAFYREKNEIGEAERLQEAVRKYNTQDCTSSIGRLSKFSVERIGAVCSEIRRSCTADTEQGAMFRLRQAVALLRDMLERITYSNRGTAVIYVDSLTQKRQAASGILRGSVWMSDDFNETPDVFREYL